MQLFVGLSSEVETLFQLLPAFFAESDLPPPISAADLLNDRVLPFYESQERTIDGLDGSAVLAKQR